eukprot:8216372-Karenia_brevis.AAC.1
MTLLCEIVYYISYQHNASPMQMQPASYHTSQNLILPQYPPGQWHSSDTPDKHPPHTWGSSVPF